MEKTAVLQAENSRAKRGVRTAVLAGVIVFAFAASGAASGAVSTSGIGGFSTHSAAVKSAYTDTHVLAGNGQSGCCGEKN